MVLILEEGFDHFSVIETDKEFEEPKLPSYSDPGSILVKILTILDNPGSYYRYELDVLDYDSGSSVFWLNEGMGIDYWLNDAIDFKKPGYYVIEHVTGYYHRGDGYSTDDDEEWDYKQVRRATLRERLFKRLFEGEKE